MPALVTVKLPAALGRRLDAVRLDDESRSALAARLLDSALDTPPPGDGPTPLMEVLAAKPPAAGHRRHVAVASAFDGRAELCSCGAVRAGSGPWYQG
jgi:hypothetical protein